MEVIPWHKPDMDPPQNHEVLVLLKEGLKVDLARWNGAYYIGKHDNYPPSDIEAWCSPLMVSENYLKGKKKK